MAIKYYSTSASHFGLYIWVDSSSHPLEPLSTSPGTFTYEFILNSFSLACLSSPILSQLRPFLLLLLLSGFCFHFFNLSSTFHFSSPYLFLLLGHTSGFLETFISKSLHFSTVKSTKMRCLSAHTLPFFPPQYAKFPYLLKVLHLLCWILSSIISRASLLQLSIWFL